MAKETLLVVEDDRDIARLLRLYFGAEGYRVLLAHTGRDGVQLAISELPDLIILDIMLPDMNGYDIARQLRTTTRTSNIPFIFLTQRDQHSDKIASLELGADDYITKPFDAEEVKLRVRNAINAGVRLRQKDPKSGLPTRTLTEQHLQRLLKSDSVWTYIDVKIRYLEAFSEVYSFIAGDEVLRFTANLVREVVQEYGTAEDFIGHPWRDNFVIVTHATDAYTIEEQLRLRFDAEIASHYSFTDRDRGMIEIVDAEGQLQSVPLMSLLVRSVQSNEHHFSDVHELTVMFAEPYH